MSVGAFILAVALFASLTIFTAVKPDRGMNDRHKAARSLRVSICADVNDPRPQTTGLVCPWSIFQVIGISGLIINFVGLYTVVYPAATDYYAALTTSYFWGATACIHLPCAFAYFVLLTALTVIDFHPAQDGPRQSPDEFDHPVDPSTGKLPKYCNCKFCEKSYPGKYRKHCWDCNRCVEGFDHHCIWLNQCIGRSNYKIWLWYVVMRQCFVVTEVFIIVSFWVECGMGKAKAFEELPLWAAVPVHVATVLTVIYGLYCSVAQSHLLYMHFVTLPQEMADNKWTFNASQEHFDDERLGWTRDRVGVEPKKLVPPATSQSVKKVSKQDTIKLRVSEPVSTEAHESDEAKPLLPTQNPPSSSGLSRLGVVKEMVAQTVSRKTTRESQQEASEVESVAYEEAETTAKGTQDTAQKTGSKPSKSDDDKPTSSCSIS